MLALRRDPIGLLTLAASFGDVSHVRLPRTSLYVLNHPELASDVLAAHHSRFNKGPTMEAARRVLGESLLTSEGELHRQRRRMLQPIFHHERIASYAADMVELGIRATRTWSDGQRIDVHAEMARLTLEIVGRTLFGVDIGTDRARQIGAALNETLSQFDRVLSPFLTVTERLPLPANRRFQRARKTFDDAVYGMIRQRRAARLQGSDVLSLLLREGDNLSDEDVRDEALTLFLAGHETTSSALTWTWYLLSEDPAARSGLRAELADVLGERLPTYADVGALPYTDAVLREAMRLFPPAWAIGRRVVSEHVAGPYTIPSGAVVVVSPWLMHRDPRWWEDPNAFRPERWLGEAPSVRGAFLPFGAGPRMCIGADFAHIEAVLLIATIARRWRFSRDPSTDVGLRPVITLRPRGGMPMTAHADSQVVAR
jgi:cytochrome P450